LGCVSFEGRTFHAQELCFKISAIPVENSLKMRASAVEV
jgi:hypothetical protein